MDQVLEGIASYLQSNDTQKAFKRIEYSEWIDDLIKDNKLPFLNVVGIKERKSPLNNISMANGYRQFYDISILIGQDARLIKKVIHGSNSIWQLWDVVWEIIEGDPSFNGIISKIDEKVIESRLITITKDNSVKLILETELTVFKDVFNN